MQKYTFKEPKGRVIEDVEGSREKRREAMMTDCVKQAVTILNFRIGKHISGPFQGLYTLEKQAKGRWVPVKDGDLLVQIMDDIHTEVQKVVNADPNRKTA